MSINDEKKSIRFGRKLDQILPQNLKQYLKTATFGQTIRYFDSIPTTQTIAHQWAKEGATEGSMVIAEEQTAGKGRLGNQWLSPANEGIWMSLILRPPIMIKEASQMMILSSLAVNRAIWAYTQLPIQIKWPNDLLINGKKVCGILTELKGKQDQVDYVVVGVGINVNLASSLNQVERPITSLAAECGKSIDRAVLLATILNVWEQWYDLYRKKGFQPIKQNWEQDTPIVGKKITARTPEGNVAGVVRGINQWGALVLQTKQGLKAIYSADIEY